jgi:hypothetical protein
LRAAAKGRVTLEHNFGSNDDCTNGRGGKSGAGRVRG